MNRYRLVTSCALAVALAACSGGGPSVSGSASESAESSSGLSSLWERVKSLGIETGKTYEMPALGLMADAFLQDLSKRELEPDDLAQIFLAPREGGRPRLDTAVVDAIEPTRKGLSQVEAQKLRKITPLDAEHMVYAAPITIALQPRKGWEVQAMDDRVVDPRFDTPFFRQNRPAPTYNEELHVRYMEMLAISTMYTNAVFGMIDEELGTSRLADPDAATQQILLTFQKIPVATLKSLLQNAAQQVSSGRFNTDLTGSGNIHFENSRAGDFVADPRGVTWTKAGGIWFGDGRINGQNVTLRLASTSSLSQRQAQSGTQGSNSGAKVEGSGSVGPGR